MTARAGLFTTGDVAAATGASSRLQCQRWAHRIYTPSPGDTTPTGPGDDRYMTVQTVYQIGITEETAKANVPIRVAARASAKFSEPQTNRRASELFATGRTLLLVKPGTAEIVNAPFDATLPDVLGRPLQPATIIDLGPIVAAVNEKLISLTKRKTRK
jgi:hypothetical protein